MGDVEEAEAEAEAEEEAGETETNMLPVMMLLLLLTEPEPVPELELVLEPSSTVRPPLAVAMASVECSWTRCSNRSGKSSVDHISALSCRTLCLC